MVMFYDCFTSKSSSMISLLIKKIKFSLSTFYHCYLLPLCVAKYKFGEEQRKENKRKKRTIAKNVKFSPSTSVLNENLFSRIKFYFVLVILATREYDQS